MVPYQCPPGSPAPCICEQQSPCGGIQTECHLPYLKERTSMESSSDIWKHSTGKWTFLSLTHLGLNWLFHSFFTSEYF